MNLRPLLKALKNSNSGGDSFLTKFGVVLNVITVILAIAGTIRFWNIDNHLKKLELNKSAVTCLQTFNGSRKTFADEIEKIISSGYICYSKKEAKTSEKCIQFLSQYQQTYGSSKDEIKSYARASSCKKSYLKKIENIYGSLSEVKTGLGVTNDRIFSKLEDSEKMVRDFMETSVADNCCNFSED